jgi:hypothetical protein
MPFLLRLLLLLLAGASIVGARHAARQSDAQFLWPAAPAMRATVPAGQAVIAEFGTPLRPHHAL